MHQPEPKICGQEMGQHNLAEYNSKAWKATPKDVDVLVLVETPGRLDRFSPILQSVHPSQATICKHVAVLFILLMPGGRHVIRPG